MTPPHGWPQKRPSFRCSWARPGLCMCFPSWQMWLMLSCWRCLAGEERSSKPGTHTHTHTHTHLRSVWWWGRPPTEWVQLAVILLKSEPNKEQQRMEEREWGHWCGLSSSPSLSRLPFFLMLRRHRHDLTSPQSLSPAATLSLGFNLPPISPSVTDLVPTY